MRFQTFAFALVLAFTSFAGCAAEPGTVVDASGGSAEALSGRPYFEVWQTSSQHYFHFVAANHEVLLGSEGYTTRTLALKGLLSVLDNGQLPGRFRTQQATNGQWYFTLRASNGEIIATSELYAQRSNADQGVSAVIANCAAYEAWLADRTGARFDIFRGADGRHYYNLHAANGEIVLRSQAYSSEAAALNGAFSVKDHGVSATRYDVRQATNGQWYFNVTAANGQVIGTSELYTTRYNAERARDSIIALLPSVEML